MRAVLRRTLLLAAVSALVGGCAGPQISYGQLSALDKGMSKSDVATRLGQPPLASHTATASGRTIDFHRYRMNNGMQADLYLLAYERERLVFWGYISEFRRQPDAELSQALTTVLREAATARQ